MKPLLFQFRSFFVSSVQLPVNKPKWETSKKNESQEGRKWNFFYIYKYNGSIGIFLSLASGPVNIRVCRWLSASDTII